STTTIGPVRFSQVSHDSGCGVTDMAGSVADVPCGLGAFASGSKVLMLFCSFISFSFGTLWVREIPRLKAKWDQRLRGPTNMVLRGQIGQHAKTRRRIAFLARCFGEKGD